MIVDQVSNIGIYRVVKVLGKGAFGKVFLVTCPDSPEAEHNENGKDARKYAMKSFPNISTNANKALGRMKGPSPLDCIRYEIAVMKRLAHPNLVALKEVCKHALLVYTYCVGC